MYRLEAALQVEEDLKFWISRIQRAIRFGRVATNNQWSLRGSTSTFYLNALQKRLGRGFAVSTLYVGEKEFVSISW